MCVYIYIRIYVCVYMCAYIYIYICIYVCIYVCVCVCVCVCIYIYIYNLSITCLYREKFPVAEHQKLSGTRFIFLIKKVTNCINF